MEDPKWPGFSSTHLFCLQPEEQLLPIRHADRYNLLSTAPRGGHSAPGSTSAGRALRPGRPPSPRRPGSLTGQGHG